MPPTENPLWTRLLWWTLFAAAFGYVEALVVVYVRRLTQMPPGLDYHQVWTLRHLAWNGPTILAEMRRLGVYDTEFTREIATLLLLVGPACAAGRTGRERLALFPVYVRRVGRDVLPVAEALDPLPAITGKHGHLLSGPHRLVRAGLVPCPGGHACLDRPGPGAAQAAPSFAAFSFPESLISAATPGVSSSSAPRRKSRRRAGWAATWGAATRLP